MSRRSKGGGVPISLFSFQDLITSLSGILILLVLLMAVQVALRKAIPVKARVSPERIVDVSQLNKKNATLKKELEELSQVMTLSVSQDSVAVVQLLTDEERKLKDRQREVDRQKEMHSSLVARLINVQQKEVLSQKATQPLKQELVQLRAALGKTVSESKLFYIPEEGALKTPILVECSGVAIRMGFISRSEKPTIFSPDRAGIVSFEKHISRYSPSREYFVFMIKPSGVDYWEALSKAAYSLQFDVGYDALEEGKSIGFGNERL